MAKTSEAEATISTVSDTAAELWNSGAAEVGAWRFWIEAQETTALSNATALTALVIAVVHQNSEAAWLIGTHVASRADIGGASTWGIEVQLDGSGYIEVNVTGASGDNVDWRMFVEKLA